MSAHQSLAAAARRDDSEPSPFRREDGPRPTMNELLASCAAASAISTPPDAPEAQTGPEARPEPVSGAAHLPAVPADDRDAA
ncbi:hypothetical protein [Streptomyces olivaceiscleroticus]